jgi:hypothetical protein
MLDDDDDNDDNDCGIKGAPPTKIIQKYCANLSLAWQNTCNF